MSELTYVVRKWVKPEDLNQHGALFGGRLLQAGRDVTFLVRPKRAELIAVTETTRLFGLGSQAIYQAQGYTHWEM